MADNEIVIFSPESKSGVWENPHEGCEAYYEGGLAIDLPRITQMLGDDYIVCNRFPICQTQWGHIQERQCPSAMVRSRWSPPRPFMVQLPSPAFDAISNSYRSLLRRNKQADHNRVRACIKLIATSWFGLTSAIKTT